MVKYLLAILLILSEPVIASSISCLPKETSPYYEHKLAVTQVKILEKVITEQIREYLHREGINRDPVLLARIVDASFKCSFVFTSLGQNHIDAFVRFLEWGYEETNFCNMQCSWKKGQVIRRLGITISQDSTDYGIWQINDVCDWDLIPRLNYYYEAGDINFKIKHIRQMNDFSDVPTNLAMRCVVENQRKKLHWDWKHDDSPHFKRFIKRKIKELEKEGLYNSDLVDKYYYLEPIKIIK